MNDGVLNAIRARLDGDAGMSEVRRNLVLGACGGPDALSRILRGESMPEPPSRSSGQTSSRRAFLKAIEVQGFRGVGVRARLELQPGPGLTLVIGRNGSGKSSFAEGVEVLLTGDSHRWNQRSKVWKDGWKNLHHRGEAYVEADLVVEGKPGGTRVRRSWSAACVDVAGGLANCLDSDGAKGSLDGLGWTQALRTYRPFLSYNELGSMLDGKPTEMFDAVSAMLGLDDLVAARELLRSERLELERQGKAVDAGLASLLHELRQSADPRAEECVRALEGRKRNLDRATEIVTGTQDPEGRDDELSRLRRWAALPTLEPEVLSGTAARLRAVHEAVARARATEAERSRKLAALLESALHLHEGQEQLECPVCHTGVLDQTWREKATREVESHRHRAREAEQARTELRSALDAARRLLVAAPPDLAEAGALGLNGGPLASLWARWSGGAPGDDPVRLADHLEQEGPSFAAAVHAFRDEAAAALARRESAWRPLAARLSSWLAQARSFEAAGARLPDLKQAEDWLKKAEADIRQDRFGPIAEEVRDYWTHLRQGSNVELVQLALEGTTTTRKLSMAVAIDGVDGAALGVMSQGELMSLALSLFLPRATISESPFGFVLIDDPVQSMDPAKVDGLARVLQKVSQARQVVVFTHDDRLYDSIRRMGIAADVLEVHRRPNSAVEVRKVKDPIEQMLQDAMALVKTPGLSMEVAARVVPGFCRMSLEAACTRTYRRKRLSQGDSHLSVEEELVDAVTLKDKMALALLGDAERGGEVLQGHLARFGERPLRVYQDLNRGSHGAFDGDPFDLVKSTRVLVEGVLSS